MEQQQRELQRMRAETDRQRADNDRALDGWRREFCALPNKSADLAAEVLPIAGTYYRVRPGLLGPARSVGPFSCPLTLARSWTRGVVKPLKTHPRG